MSKAKHWAADKETVLLRLSHVADGKLEEWQALRLEGKGGSRIALSTNFCKYKRKHPLGGMQTTQPLKSKLFNAKPQVYNGVGGVESLIKSFQ
jgi:hypothetical protein